MSHKSVPQECPIRVSHKSVPQECPTRVSYKRDPQECPECPTRVSHKSVPTFAHRPIPLPQLTPSRVPAPATNLPRQSQCDSDIHLCKSVLQECPTRVSYKSDQECPRRVSHKSVLQECPTRVSYKSVPQECPQPCSCRIAYAAAATCPWATGAPDLPSSFQVTVEVFSPIAKQLSARLDP